MSLQDLLYSRASEATNFWKQYPSKVVTSWDQDFAEAMESLHIALHVDDTDDRVHSAISVLQNVLERVDETQLWESVGGRLASKIDRMLDILDLSETDDIEALRERVAALEQAAEPFRDIARQIPDDAAD